MSHRKFEAPRHGSLGFLPRKRARRVQGRIKSFPKDDATRKPHLTAFMGFKAGMTHIVRDVDKPGSKLHKKESLDAVTIIETPPMVVVGLVGYTRTTQGLQTLGTVWAHHLSEQCLRKFYKNWYRSKRKAFSRYKKLWNGNHKGIDKRIKKIVKYSQVIRVIAHTQPRLIRKGQKKAHLLEIQVNGGASIIEKVKFAQKLFEREIRVDSVFKENDMIDVIGVSKGKGFEGVTTRWGTTRLPRKTHKGLRKVACIGAWHPSRVKFSVPRAGQNGFHHRTERNKKIYRIGSGKDSKNASTESDLTAKSITPLGGFPHYGNIVQDWIMIKGACVGTRKRPLTLRLPIRPETSRNALEQIKIKFIDTSSKFGHGRFQTAEEKARFFGPTKKTKALQKKKTDRATKAQIKAKQLAAKAAQAKVAKKSDKKQTTTTTKATTTETPVKKASQPAKKASEPVKKSTTPKTTPAATTTSTSTTKKANKQTNKPQTQKQTAQPLKKTAPQARSA
eukprot:TRINITY_DN5969_c0_g1_i1.p1 TRINITY_DN5969_c0_g1~~TRINITY_DN5969_c0_g1_i1.p1  ORF type:complete len:504 (-),score=251.41 TRINITY_DN5969_c0_g1_i1:269-1780(-)